MKTKITSFILMLLGSLIAISQNCSTYYPFKEGAKFQITNFNPKGKKPLTLSFLEDKKDSWWDRIFNKREVDRRNLLKAIWEGDTNTILIKYGDYIRLKKDELPKT